MASTESDKLHESPELQSAASELLQLPGSLYEPTKVNGQVMVKIRLARHGAKKKPYYHIVVTDVQNARDGSFLEQIGVYDPNKPMAEARIERDRLDYWVGVGAQITESLKKVVREHAKAAAAAG
jgi:small subunit ribosomal protein S16